MSSLSHLLLNLQGWLYSSRQLVSRCLARVFFSLIRISSQLWGFFTQWLWLLLSFWFLCFWATFSHWFFQYFCIFCHENTLNQPVSTSQAPVNQIMWNSWIPTSSHKLEAVALSKQRNFFPPSQSIFFLKPHSGPLTSSGSRASAPVSLCIKMVMLLCLWFGSAL